jgi:hypothetical protein
VHDFSSRSGEFRTCRGKRRFDDDEPTSVKRVRRRALPSIEQFDATDGLPQIDRWSIWDQSENLVPNIFTCRSGLRAVSRTRL